LAQEVVMQRVSRVADQTMARPSVGSIRGSLREILAKPIIVRPASVFDPLSCRMAASQGFSAIQLAGSVAANVVLGAPDLMLLSVSEFADLCRRLCTRDVRKAYPSRLQA